MAKWIKNAYDKALTYENLMRAHELSKKGKRNRKEIILFEINKEKNIEELYNDLKYGRYAHGSYTSFKVYEPKERTIEKAPYRDRIVHRWIVDNFLIPYYIPSLIQTTYACISKRGMHASAINLQKGLRKMKKSYRNFYILKMDIRKYFNNIDKNILWRILSRRIKDKKVMWVIGQVLKAQPRKKGIEIGNYTSQTFANIYLNEVDQYVTRILKVKYYYRYMDDIVLFTKNKQDAKDILEKIKIFLRDNLELELNDKTAIFKSNQGVNFCGYKINEYRLKIRDKGKRKFKKKNKKLLRAVKVGAISSKEARQFLNGHIGYFFTANTYNLRKKHIWLESELKETRIY